MQAEGKNFKILIAEDVPMNMLLAKMLVEKILPGALVLEAADGYITLDKIMLEKPDLLLLDIQMPGLDGVGISQTIRKNTDPKISSMPIVAVTASALKNAKKRCLDAGVNAFLTKPLKHRELGKILHHYLGNNISKINQTSLLLKEQLHFDLVNLENRIGGNKILLQELLVSSISEIEKHLFCLMNPNLYNLENLNHSARIIFEISVTMSFPRLRRVILKTKRGLQNGKQLQEDLLLDLANEWGALKNIFQKIID
jgi:CheY-like chemotaxis protein